MLRPLRGWSAMSRSCHAYCGPLDPRITSVSRALLAGFKACASFRLAGCYWWRPLAVDGGSGASRGHAPEMRRPASRWSGAVVRPSVFQAGHIPSWRGSCERYALPPVAAVWSPGNFVDISIMLLLVSNCQIGARNPLGLSCRADVVSGRDCNIARCSRTRRS